MAPTGPRGGSQAAAHVPRGPRRGGISKNRGPIRTDRDGDVSMDAPAGAAGQIRGGRGGRPARGGRGPYGPLRARGSTRIADNLRNLTENGAKKPYTSRRVTLKVTYLAESKAASNPDGGKKSLIEFIERKVKGKSIRIGRNIMVGDTLWINVPQEDVPEILQLDGYSHAGAPISIDVTTDPMPVRDSNEISSDAKEIKEKLTAVLARRYSPEQRLLDLSTLGTDEILSNIGTFDSKNVARKAFRTLLYIAEIEYKDPAARSEAIQAVSIASNDIDDVKQVFALATSLPDLKRLDLSNNKIDSVPKLAAWQGRLKNLEELHLAGNPIVEQADYAAQLLKWFPSLQILNGQAVRTPEEVALARRAQEPTPLPTYPSNLRDGDNNIASEFVSHFFAAYDDDRARLAAEFYDQESWFSLSVIPTNARNHNFKAYMKYSRDIQSLGPRDTKVVQRLFTGGTLIGDLWKALPATRHPRLDDTSQWIVDCHTFPHLADPSGQGSAMGLFINVHGRFEEADQANNNYGTRTFSRVFILAPSKPVPPPPHPYRVISDQLTLHDWVPAPSPPATSAPVTLNAPVVSVAPPAQVPIAPVPIAQVPIAQVPIPTEPTAIVPDDNMKAQFLQELSKRTGMTAEYSQMCLDTSGWNFEAALKLFEEKRAELPAEAFIPGSV